MHQFLSDPKPKILLNSIRAGASANTVTLKKDGSGLAAPRDVPRYGQHHPVDMTSVCIDILETILIESRKSNGQPPYRRTWWHPGWMEAHTKLIEHGSGATLRLHELS
jgi:hypothetical protein